MKALDSLLVSDLVTTAGIYLLGNIRLGISRSSVAESWNVHTWIRKIYHMLLLAGLRSLVQLDIIHISDLIF